MTRSLLLLSTASTCGVLLAACGNPEPDKQEPFAPGPSDYTVHEPDAPNTDWTLVATDPAAAVMSVSGTSENNVWAVGASDSHGGLILHWDGTRWERIENSDPHDLWWVQVFDDGTVVVAGAGGTVLRGNEAGFERIPTPGLGAQTLYGLWGTDPDHLWAVGGFAGRWGFAWRWDGTTWTDSTLPDDIPLSSDGELPSLFKVWGRSMDDVWVVGGNGLVMHHNGVDWTVLESGTEELLFTIHGNDDHVAIVGPRTVLLGNEAGLVEVAPSGVGLLQGACFESDGTLLVSGASGTVWERDPTGDWEQHINTTGVSPESLHAVWASPEGGRWAVGGGVLSADLDEGVVFHQGPLADTWTAPEVEEPGPASCPADAIDPTPDATIARRWNEQILNAIRRDIPRPGVHARNLFHSSIAMWDAWAVYQSEADPYLSTERHAVEDDTERLAARETALSMATYRVLTHRYADQQGGDVSTACFDAFMAELGLDPTDTHTDGDDSVAVGNRIGQLVIDSYADDGANEAHNYADTTGWEPLNPPLVVDQPGVDIVDPDDFQLLNLAAAETQNGIVLDTGLQSYIGAQWGWVAPFALGPDLLDTYDFTYIDPGLPFPTVDDTDLKRQVLEVIKRHGKHDPTLPETIDLSPGAYGNNPLGTDDGTGHPVNPVTGESYAPNVVAVGDFSRVLAEFWADGPHSETPPGHWNVLANEVSDTLDPSDLQVAELGVPLDRLAWDVHLYLALNGAVHDAAVASWGLKRESLGARPISFIRWMAQNGQSTDPSLPSYHVDGLPLQDGVVELITEDSAAPGERHHHLRWFIGEVAIISWRGEPGNRADDTAGVAWMRAVEWFPYQRRTFVTPAFPGYVSGHSTFSRAAAEVLTRMTGSPYFPGGLGEFVAPAGDYLIFEDGPTTDVRLQWGTYQDAADQAGQSRLWGGIHVEADDLGGRLVGYEVGHLAMDEALMYFDGSARAD